MDAWEVLQENKDSLNSQDGANTKDPDGWEERRAGEALTGSAGRSAGTSEQNQSLKALCCS